MPVWVQWTTFGIAVIGALLGIFNAFLAVRRDSVRLRVRFVTIIDPTGPTIGGIEVTNVGHLAATITEVAFTGRAFGKNRAVIMRDYLRRFDLPYRLEPRTEVTVTIAPEVMDDLERDKPTHVLAKTACGVVEKSRIEYS